MTGDRAVTTVNLAETLEVCRRLYGLDSRKVTEVLTPLLGQRLQAIPLDTPLAQPAAGIRLRYYHRSTRPISLADAIVLAAASQCDRVTTADPHLLGIAEDRAIGPVALAPEG